MARAGWIAERTREFGQLRGQQITAWTGHPTTQHWDEADYVAPRTGEVVRVEAARQSSTTPTNRRCGWQEAARPLPRYSRPPNPAWWSVTTDQAVEGEIGLRLPIGWGRHDAYCRLAAGRAVGARSLKAAHERPA
jgi:hypothetical protein